MIDYLGAVNISKNKNRTLGFIVMVRYRNRFFMWQPLKPMQPRKPKSYKVKTEGYLRFLFFAIKSKKRRQIDYTLRFLPY